MKINKKQLAKIIKKSSSDDELKENIKYIFQYPENINLFAEFFFPNVVTNSIPKFHKKIYQELFEFKNSAIAAPRGHGKSSLTGIVFLIHRIVNDAEKYILYVSQNHAKTLQFIEPVRDEFKKNKLLRFVYGDMIIKNTKYENGKDRQDCFDVNDCRVEAVSFEKNMRGFKYKNIRPTLIICDDIEDDSRVLNPVLRVKDAEKLNKIIIPSLDIDGKFKFIGTILHEKSLLSKKIIQYNGPIYKTCDLTLKNNKPILTNLLWKDRFTIKKLLDIRKSIGSLAFQQEYMNNPYDNETSIIKKEWIEACLDTSISYVEPNSYSFHKDIKKFHNTTLGVDFAFSDRITANRSAFVTIAQPFMPESNNKKSKRSLESGRKNLSVIQDLANKKEGQMIPSTTANMDNFQSNPMMDETHSGFSFDNILDPTSKIFDSPTEKILDDFNENHEDNINTISSSEMNFVETKDEDRRTNL